MHKCLDLSRLPKAPGLRSIKRRNVTPGSLVRRRTTLRAPPTQRTQPPGGNPTHFRISPAPHSCYVLYPRGNRKDGPKRLDMSIFFMIAKKKTNKRAVVRNRIAMRIRSAFELIVTRGADSEPKDNVEDHTIHPTLLPRVF
ncbi:hypothetical protein DEU56DRAFT_915535 [Suillus clintonianus]|uniref:uncharacterized protein n=1 Tax=Suillus clintonianus TaxID=1904413 RepID=UPI001B866AA9|nr:uncharacterized protein DEU56DRAFT_915535 [Suillus clintonianus]KAG2128276.1 hypothetical protein DEU56DRAFT_915535 [Suillus clintonianus]